MATTEDERGARYELAQVNVALLRAPLHDPRMRGFVAAFDPVARLAEEAPGFRWRWSDGGGHATVPTETGQEQIVNLSVWSDYAALHAFVYRSLHGRVLLRRSDWFLPTPEPSTALWWVPTAERPTVEHALARLALLRREGPSPRAFSLLRQFDAAGRPAQRRRAGSAARLRAAPAEQR